jgi:hypothetical protein
MTESPATLLVASLAHTTMRKDKCWKGDLTAISTTLISLAKQAGDMITSARPISSGPGTKLV